MGKRHVIAEAVFDISFDSAAAAREQEPELGAFIQNRLLPLADEICSELSSDGAVSRIDRLEIDLGDISYSGFRGEMESRFKEKFRSVLQDKIQSLAPAYSYSPSAIEGIVSEPQAEREQLEHFLETGRMARNDHHGTREASDELLARAVQHSGKGLVEFLKKTPKQDIVVKRLVKQFSDQHLAAIMQLLAPAHARLLENLVGEFGKTWKADIYGIPEKEFKSLIWERLINELLKSANGASDPERFFQKTTQTLFLQHAKSQNTVDGETQPHKNSETVHEAHHQEKLPERMSQERLLAARLEAALVEGNAGEISGSWDEICRNHAGIIRETFARRMGDESARDKLAEGFPEAMLHDLIRILIPTESHFLQALANELHTAGATSARNSLIWKHALGYLHAAAGYDRSGHALSFSAYLSGQPHQDSLARETGQQEEIVPPNMATAGMPRAEALYQRLVQRMRSARPEGEMAQEIEELARNYPETIERLYRRLQSGEIRANIAGLTAGEARRLTTSFIGLNQGGGEAGFRRAIEAQAKSAPSEQRYYQFILEKLIGSQIVDLEEAAQCHEAVSPDEDSRRNSTPASPEAVVEPQPENEEPALEHVELLRILLEEALALGRVEGVVERWGELCLNHADLIRDAFIRRMGDESARGKLARGFPEAMLYDLIGILVPMESHFIATLAKQSELHTGETGTSSDVNMALWDFTLAYLHAVELSGYERPAYVSGLIGHLAGQGLPSAFIRQAYADLSMEKRLADGDYAIAFAQETGQEIIAPEAALGEAQDAAQEPSATAEAQLRSRLEAALAGGNASELSGIWGELCFNHADLVRETCRRVMGEPALRKNLAQGFPEAMLLDLTRVLAPQESSFIEALVRQPELRAESTGSSAILRALWEHTLGYLHGAGTRSFSRMEYTRGLTPLMVEQGMDQAKLRQAVTRIDPSLSAVLTEFVPEAETPEMPKRRTTRADELYEQIKRHLSGKAPQTGAPPDLAPAIEELANTYPETLARLHRQLQAGEIRANLGLLSAREARQLTAALIGLNHGGKESEFQRAIEAHAGKAQNEQRYYRHILEKLLHNQIIDLEAALGEAQEAAQESSATAEAPAEREQHRNRLEAALAGGNAFELSGIWGDLCFNHADLVRETCRRVMGEPGLRKNLAQGFPEAMLLDLIRLLAPQESSFIEALVRQPELRAESTGSSTILRALWEHTLAYLYGAGARSFSRMEYTRGLTPLMAEQGMDQAKLRQAISRIDPSLSDVVPEAETPETLRRRTARAAELYEQLKRRLGGEAQRESAPPDLAPAIEELANTYPETLARLQRQLQAGEIRANLSLLSAREARHLTAALIGLNHGGKESEFQRAIGAHAGKAQNEQRYYRHILEKLLHNQIIDLEAALDEAQDAAQESSATAEAPAEREQHRSRLEAALAGGNASELSGIWDELRLKHAGLIRETYRRVMGDPGQRKNLAQGFPEDMLRDLAGLLAPQESGFIGTLSKQPELQAGASGNHRSARRALWEHTLAYLHATEEGGFSRPEYARSLISWMAGQGLERSALLQALRRTDASLEKILAETPPESGVDETPKLAQHPPAASTTAEAPDIKLLRSRLETALTGGNAFELSGIWGDLCFNHADLIRETCRRRMGESGLRKNLAQGFPEAMLLDLIRLLAPQESSFIEALVRQPELRAESTGSSAILRALWEHTLGYLHGAGTRSFSRMEYTRGLTPLMVEQGMDQAKLRQAITRIDPSLSAVLAEFVPEAETPEMPKRQPARAAELYEQLKRHLSGKAPQTGAPPDLAPAIEELANAYPETLSRLQRQLQAGEIRANLGVLSAREARQLTAALIGLTHGGKESEFQRAIEAYAGKAQNEQRYYRHILEKLLDNQIIDLEAALGEAQEAAQEPNATAEAPAEREQHRNRLEAALAGGDAFELNGIWGELCFNHADLVRETCRRVMGEPGLRKNLAQGFPEAMLLDLTRVLAPQESSFIEALVRQPELRAESTGSSTILRALWEHTLAYLHGAGTRSFSRMEYTRGLTPLMAEQGMDQAKLRQAVTRIDPSLSDVVPEAETPETLRRRTARAAELYEQLKRHLSGKAPQTGAPPDLAPAIEELADAYPETLARLQRQLQAGEIRANLGLLSAREARQLTAALIGLNHGGKESEFQHAIETHAGKAQNEQRYYRHILEKLLDNQIINLEAALDEAQENAENIHLQIKGGQPSVAAKPRPEGAKVSTPDANRRGEIMEETTEEIYIANAGMVLVTPYLPQLFRMLGLTEGSKFKDERAAERAIHLLQYTVNESCDSPEFLLALNKIMCGLVTGIPIVRGIELLPVEKETIEGMLKAIIQRWTIIGNTSVQGLRESFLQRGGRLQLREDSWHLKVERKGIDVLLDRLPWSISIVKHPWMALPIYVEW